MMKQRVLCTRRAQTRAFDLRVSIDRRTSFGDRPTEMLQRVAIAVSHPIQHFCPLYAALAADGRLELKVFFGSTAGVRPYYDPGFATTIQWSGNLTAGYDHEFLSGAETADPAKGVDGHGLSGLLAAWNPAVVQ